MTAQALRQVTIVGLGLIGGSIAKSLRLRDPKIELVAVDRDNVGTRSDVRDTITRFICDGEARNHREDIARSDLVVLCQPVSVIAETIHEYVAPHCVVTDTGSTKRHIVKRAAPLQGASWFVPGHPMAGKAQGGFENSCVDLFLERPWILCTGGRNPDATTRVEAFVDGLGARRVTMTPEDHDRAIALVSHLPQLLASWLQIEGLRRSALSVAGPAFKDMTRVAGGADTIWRDIFETNADEVGAVLRDGAFALAALADAMLSRPPHIDRVLELLDQARQAKSQQ